MTYDEEDRQMILLALAVLSLQRPGFDYALCEIAKKLTGEFTYRLFQDLNRQPPAPEPGGNRMVLL